MANLLLSASDDRKILRDRGALMGDKSPKSKDKNKKQTAGKKADTKIAHDQKQAKPVAPPKAKKG